MKKKLPADSETFRIAMRNLLYHLDPDPEREGLRDTPARVAKAWAHWTAGHDVEIRDLFKTFEDGSQDYDEMVVERRIPFFSHCEHHLAPFFGTASIAYIPDGRVVGLSKLVRLLDAFSQRLQVQERLTVQIADAMMEYLQPKGAGVIINARHLCMESRGVCRQGQDTVTRAFRGVIFDKPEARAEFLSGEI